MTSKINRLGILLYMLFFSWLSNANINNHRYVNITQYDIYEGLAGNKVTQIAQDEMGYMWFGTHSGLSRFDSQNFENLDLFDFEAT